METFLIRTFLILLNIGLIGFGVWNIIEIVRINKEHRRMRNIYERINQVFNEARYTATDPKIVRMKLIHIKEDMTDDEVERIGLDITIREIERMANEYDT